MNYIDFKGIGYLSGLPPAGFSYFSSEIVQCDNSKMIDFYIFVT